MGKFLCHPGLRSLLGVLAPAALLLLAESAFGWNDTGHKTSALLAWDELQPAVRTKVTAILKQHPQFDEYLKDASAATPEDAARAAFLTAATWPDIVRSPVGRNRLYNHPTWHYVDFPFVVGTAPPAAASQPSADYTAGTDPANALQALEKSTAELKNPAVTDEQKAIALCWVLHLTGDIHQPLHAISMFNADFPEGDKGGNLLMVTAGGSVTNLHALWDAMLGRYSDGKIIRELADKIHQAYPREKLQEQLASKTFKSWAEESFAAAKEVVYQNGKLPYLSKDKLQADKKTPVPEVPKDYLETGKELARKRIALAGCRIADSLNALFADPPAPK